VAGKTIAIGVPIAGDKGYSARILTRGRPQIASRE